MNDRKLVKILVMEDNEMYNSLLTKKLQLYTESLSLDTNFTFEINSFTSLPDFIKNLKEDADVVFLDYFLVKNITALDILTKIKQVCKKCKIFVISRTNDTEIINKIFEKGIDDFIFKDKYALAHSCFLLKKAVYNMAH
ncbi:MAG TPA: response regulator [Cytophagaceae bacterium]|jgi:response regulator of citrate/malate metabolism|nr:response regulator [Cytophagaceae bacterium]